MADVTHVGIEEIDLLQGFERVGLRRAAAALGVSSFGISIEELGQEEIYVALRGSGTLEADGESYPIDPDHIVRVGPAVKRKIVAGPDGLRLLAIGGTPGEAYETGGTL